MHTEALYSGVEITQPKKDYNNQHWIDKILEEYCTPQENILIGK
jgi:hypothetical protein